MNVIKKNKMKADLKNIINANKDFSVFVDHLISLDIPEQNIQNLQLLKTHLGNMSIVFNNLLDSMDFNNK